MARRSSIIRQNLVEIEPRVGVKGQRVMVSLCLFLNRRSPPINAVVSVVVLEEVLVLEDPRGPNN